MEACNALKKDSFDFIVINYRLVNFMLINFNAVLNHQ